MLDVPSPLSTLMYAPVITKRSCAYVPGDTTASDTSSAVLPASVVRSVVTGVFISTVEPWLPCRSISAIVTTAAFTSPGASVRRTENRGAPPAVVAPPQDAIVPNARDPATARPKQRCDRAERVTCRPQGL